jgi:hypothetical protein
MLSRSLKMFLPWIGQRFRNSLQLIIDIDLLKEAACISCPLIEQSEEDEQMVEE